MEGDLRQTLIRFRNWLLRNAPPLEKQLRPGLRIKEIQAAICNASVPLSASCFPLFEVFNGQRSHKASLLPCRVRGCSGLKLASLDDMQSWRDGLSSDWLEKHMNVPRIIRANLGVGEEFWKNDWLPFAVGESTTDSSKAHSVYLVLDFAPNGAGVVGQVFLNETETSLNSEGFPVTEAVTRTVVASSLNEFFVDVVHDLESGRAGYRRGQGIVWL